MFNSFANKLTVSRIIVIPAILIFLAIPHAWAAYLALVFFIAAGVTDWLDGYMARRDNEVTKIGQFLIPSRISCLFPRSFSFLLTQDKSADGAFCPPL